MNGSTHVHMLIIEEMWKKSLIHSNINVGLKKITCVLLNNGKCKMQLLNNGFNMLKVDGSTSLCTMLIVKEMSKKSLTHYNALCK